MLKCFQIRSHFDKKCKEFSSFILIQDFVGKLDWLLSHISVQILYRAISEVKCFSLWETCKDHCSEPPHSFFFKLLNKFNNLIGCWLDIINLHSNLLCYIPMHYLRLILVAFNGFFGH